jgi:hypothetical protein
MELKDMREMMMQSLCLMHPDHEIHFTHSPSSLTAFCNVFLLYPNKAGLRHYLIPDLLINEDSQFRAR